MPDNAQLLQIAIATPLLSALVIGLGLPKRLSVKLAAVAFVVPALISVWLWSQFRAGLDNGYDFTSDCATGLSTQVGISLKLGLNGISLPMFALAGIVGLAAGLYALRSNAERLKLYLMLLLIMQGGLLGTFASIDIF